MFSILQHHSVNHQRQPFKGQKCQLVTLCHPFGRQFQLYDKTAFQLKADHTVINCDNFFRNQLRGLDSEVNLRLNLRLKGYVSCQYRWTVTTTLPLEVFTQRNFVADLFD